MFIDTHCHLNFSDFDSDRAMVIGNAKKAGVKKFIVPGVEPRSCQQAVALAKKHPGVVFAGIGFHPYEAQKNQETGFLESLIVSSRTPIRDPLEEDGSRVKPGMTNTIIAIGECGLDYHQYKGHQVESRKDNQKRLFESQLRLALKYDLPVIMHCRDAFEDLFDVIDSLPRIPRGVLHCFSGGLAHLRAAQERNLFIGIDGNVTYSKHLQTIVPHIPLSLLFLETDAPYLTPIPHRGRRNEPKYIPLIAKKIAELKGVSVKEVEDVTTRNAHSLFQISQYPSILVS